LSSRYYQLRQRITTNLWHHARTRFLKGIIMKLSLAKNYLLSSAFAISAVGTAEIANADDIEIYTTVNNSSNTAIANHNILFVMDTSGSMAWSVASLSSAGGYDPTEDYGDSDDKIYVYNSELDFTGNTIESDQNKCQTLANVFGSATTYPVYYDQGIQWQQTTDNPDTPNSTNDWKSAFINTSNSSSVFECRNDNGSHGIDGVSSNTYVEDCPYGTECTSPRYTSTANDEINWHSSPFKYFVPGNYHDYLENGGTVDMSVLLADEQDASTYCSQSNNDRIGDIFIDSDTKLVFECFERIQVMKDAVSNLVSSLAAAPINIGLMRFNRRGDAGSSTQGGTVVNAVGDISTNGPAFATALNALPASGGTPLSESLYEAYRYYRGNSMDYGRTINCGTSGVVCTASAARSGNNYISPITSSCQTNNIIFLSDGEPSWNDGGRDAQIKAAAGVTDCGTAGRAGKCLDEMALAMANRDMNLNVSGTNTVKTYTIGLDIDLPLLENTADSGNGEYFTATSLNDLEEAFQSIIVDILSDAGSFTAPAVSVNAFNESRNRNELYFALFEPSGTPRWAGNIKKYFLSNSGELLDKNGDIAIDQASSFFKETAQSFWSSLVDGTNVALGGAAGKLTTSRNIYATYDNDAPNIPQLLTASNFSSISLDELHVNSDTERADYLNWLLGKDVFDDDKDNITDEPAMFLGDPLHSTPEVVTFGGTADSPEDVLFFATNLGTLHAIDPADGTELWAYLAADHRANLREYILAPNSIEHFYGLDGPITLLTKEAIGSTSNNFSLAKAQLYIGERRGGSSYYGFDVSNARSQLDTSYATPFKKLFTITGAYTGKPANIANPSDIGVSSGFSDLAQTWGKMQDTYIKVAGVKTKVLILPGGYDPRHDDINYSSTAATDDSKTISDYGNAIYIVNADTGALLYSIGNNFDDDDTDPLNSSVRDARLHNLPLPMMDSIVATPNLVDRRGDGFVDMIYAIDIKGHIWRIDIDSNKSNNEAGFANGGMIADLSSSTENRRFYNSIDVSRSNINSGSNHFNLVVGSGYRASPSTTETWKNGLYFIFDDYTSSRVLEDDEELNRYKYVSETTAGVTSNRAIVLSDILETSLQAPKVKADAPFGFFLELAAGEKILQSSITFNNKVVVSSYLVSGGTVAQQNVCGGSTGSSRTYVLDANSGASVLTAEDLSGEAIIIEAGIEINVNDVESFISASGQEVVIADNNFATDANGIILTDTSGATIINYLTDTGTKGIGGPISLLFLDNLIVCDGANCDNEQIQRTLTENIELRRAYRSDWREVK
ncbi:MAG: type IV pilus assembly protein PilY1, partial [Flavobacteriales bacterium]